VPRHEVLGEVTLTRGLCGIWREALVATEADAVFLVAGICVECPELRRDRVVSVVEVFAVSLQLSGSGRF
jgi:hypothetical protein